MAKRRERRTIDVSPEINRISSWLETWMDGDGGIHGPVIHKVGRVLLPYPHNVQLLRFDNIEDTTWTQSIAAIGYVELYKKTKDKKTLDVAERIAGRLLELQRKDGSFDHAAFEHDSDPFRKNSKPLVHQAYPDIALLRLYEAETAGGKITGGKAGAKKYLRAAERNIGFLIGNYFDKSAGTFRSSLVSKVHMANMASVAIEALLRLYKINGDDSLLKIAESCGDWLYKLFNGNFVPYGDYNEHTNPLTLYNAITLQGLDDLYFETKDRKYFKLVNGILKFLLQSYDKSTGFYFHRIENGKMVKYPQYVAASGIMLWNIMEATKTGVKCDVTPHAASLKSAVYPNGGVPSYIGYGEWQDCFPCPAWVAMAFLGLVAYAGKPEISGKMNEKTNPKTNKKTNGAGFKSFAKEWGGYSFLDEKDKFTLIKNGEIIWRAEKTEEVPETNKIEAFYQKNTLLQHAVGKTVKGLKNRFLKNRI